MVSKSGGYRLLNDEQQVALYPGNGRWPHPPQAQQKPALHTKVEGRLDLQQNFGQLFNRTCSVSFQINRERVFTLLDFQSQWSRR